MGDHSEDKEPIAPSISGPKPWWQWALIFAGYLAGAVGVVASVLGVLRWYESADTVRVALHRLMTSSVVVVVAAACAATFGHMSRHYRRRFHLQRDRGLVRDLYPNRGKLINSYHKVLADAKNVFRMVGISNHTFMTSAGIDKAIRAALAGNAHLHITLVFSKPYSAIVKQREREEHRGVGRISRDCVTNLRAAIRLKQSLGADGARLHVHIDDTYAPIAFMLQRDNEVYLEPYLFGSVGRTCPTLVVGRNDDNAQVFDQIVASLDVVITSAPEAITYPDELRTWITEFGERKERHGLKRAVFLDRDGVLVEDTGYVSSPDGLRLLPGAVDGIRSLQDRYRIVIVTNQSGIARGYFSEDDLHEIHLRLLAMLADQDAFVDAIYYCPHHPVDGSGDYKRDCECRKPRDGLIRRAVSDLQLSADGSFMIGDSDRDIAAGQSAGLRTIRVGRDVGDRGTGGGSTPRVETLIEAARLVLSELASG